MTTERDRHNQLVFAEAKGVEKGRAEGLEQGAREKALETARAFLKLGIPVETVVAGTGLSQEEVEALREG